MDFQYFDYTSILILTLTTTKLTNPTFSPSKLHQSLLSFFGSVGLEVGEKGFDYFGLYN
jgi:hypothetical protein